MADAQTEYEADAQSLVERLANEVRSILESDWVCTSKSGVKVSVDEFRAYAERLIRRFAAKQRVKAKREVRAKLNLGKGTPQ